VATLKLNVLTEILADRFSVLDSRPKTASVLLIFWGGGGPVMHRTPLRTECKQEGNSAPPWCEPTFGQRIAVATFKGLEEICFRKRKTNRLFSM